ncbi:TlpA family protein disulfide reductase [Streptococcus ictaluri]|uniref:Glutathione peroxidase n=1 Tax=Streptococcus ictaluri 707-05 TaxID=764299 RepID=G5K1E0_9STRE|nr:TlpA disulfide reductase family protein [Streptococcus ictaluri]EHI70055.1 glutathione peroxidase [Streptococcus ictaluri 707-05]
MIKIIKKLLLVVPLFLLVACSNDESISKNPGLAAGDQVPNVTLRNQEGDDMPLSDFKGKKVYINVWASWCGPCRHEMPDLEKVYQEVKDQKDLVFISLTSPGDKAFNNQNPADQSKETILEVAKEEGINYPIYFDTKDNAMKRQHFSVQHL